MNRNIVRRRDVGRWQARGAGAAPPGRAPEGPAGGPPERPREERAGEAPGKAPAPDVYFGRVLKLIPGEVVGLFIAAQSLIAAQYSGRGGRGLLWGVFGFGVLATPVYLWRVMKVRARLQLALSTLAFGVWVCALQGGPFELQFGDKAPFWGALLILAVSFLAPVFLG